MEIRPVGAEFDANKWTDRQTDECHSRFSQCFRTNLKKKHLDPGSRRIWISPGSDQRHAWAP